MNSRNFLAIALSVFTMSAVFTSCSKDDEPDNSPVKADFEKNVVLSENGVIVSLTNLSQNATSYEWSFPNGSPESSTEQNPSVSYVENGTYQITLVASNGVETNSKTMEITIDDIVGSLPVTADFEKDILLSENQAIVSLKNLSQNATTYEWSFPNGSPESSTEQNPSVSYVENGTYQITLVASNGVETNSKTMEITIDDIVDNGYVPYRYLENDGIFMYYETDDTAVYQSLIPDDFNMPSRMVVFAFFNDFYKLDYGATPYKENAISILVEYQGEEFFHCVYMPVTDEHSMWAGIIGLGLPKTMGDINFYRDNPIYSGDAENQLGGTMNMSLDTENYTITPSVKQELIDLQLLKSLQIRNGNIVVVGNTGGDDNSVIQTAEKLPNLITLKFGEATIETNTDAILFSHPLDLAPSRVIGGFYLKNTIPFSLTGSKI